MLFIKTYEEKECLKITYEKFEIIGDLFIVTFYSRLYRNVERNDDNVDINVERNVERKIKGKYPELSNI